MRGGADGNGVPRQDASEAKRRDATNTPRRRACAAGFGPTQLPGCGVTHHLTRFRKTGLRIVDG